VGRHGEMAAASRGTSWNVSLSAIRGVLVRFKQCGATATTDLHDRERPSEVERLAWQEPLAGKAPRQQKAGGRECLERGGGRVREELGRAAARKHA